MEILYKIYNPEIDRYSEGGALPSWSKKGKTWGSIKDMQSHFRLLKSYGKVPGQIYGNCEVVILKSLKASEDRAPARLYL